MKKFYKSKNNLYYKTMSKKILKSYEYFADYKSKYRFSELYSYIEWKEYHLFFNLMGSTYEKTL